MRVVSHTEAVADDQHLPREPLDGPGQLFAQEAELLELRGEG